jgi:hypothetical protein
MLPSNHKNNIWKFIITTLVVTFCKLATTQCYSRSSQAWSVGGLVAIEARNPPSQIHGLQWQEEQNKRKRKLARLGGE